jgi:hypothetical protein
MQAPRHRWKTLFNLVGQPSTISSLNKTMNFSEKSVHRANDLLRIRKIAQSAQNTEMLIDGKKIINFALTTTYHWLIILK